MGDVYSGTIFSTTVLKLQFIVCLLGTQRGYFYYRQRILGVSLGPVECIVQSTEKRKKQLGKNSIYC